MLSDSGNCCWGAFCVLCIRKVFCLNCKKVITYGAVIGDVFKNQYNLKK